MRALELDPDHFFKVKSEPVHHERPYFSDYDVDSSDYSDYDDDDEYYEGLIGYHHRYYDDDSEDYNDVSSHGFSEDREDNDI